MKLKSIPLFRIVSDDKTVQGKFLNLCGAQMARTTAARAIYNLRFVRVPESVAEIVADLRREGVVVLRDFLPRDHFELIRKEALALMEQKREMANIYRHGPNTVYHLSVPTHVENKRASAILAFLAEPRIRGILQVAEKRSLGRVDGRIEHVHQGIGSEPDPESELHSDIFFHTHKAWLYLNDVKEEHGPLVYVKRSHHLTPFQLYYAYKESCTRNALSRRIARAEVDQLGLEESIMTCSENTLVVANVCGYHRRLKGEPGQNRYAVQISLRFNPFSLWLSPRPDTRLNGGVATCE
jgi:hypothetical protein